MEYHQCPHGAKRVAENKACKVDYNCRTPLGGSTSTGCMGASMGCRGGEVANTAVKCGTTFVHEGLC